MSISGPEALTALDEALRDLRREEDDILRKLMRGLERLAKIRDGESELLRQLDGLKLPPEMAGELSGAVTRTALALRGVLDARGREFAAASQRRRQLETALAERRTERATTLADIDRLQQALRALGPRIGAATASAGDYEQQRQTAVALAATAAAARAKTRQAENDCEQRTRIYRDDPLFAYLWERGYGAPAYKGNALTRMLDVAVARLIRFDLARADYTTIKALPDRLAAHAEMQAQRAAAAQDRLDALEDAAIESVGGGQLLGAMAAARARLTELDAVLAELDSERGSLVATQTALLILDSSTFDNAVARLIRALGSTDLATLIMAMRVDFGADHEAFVAQLDDVRLRLAEEQADARDFRVRLKTLAERRLALEGIERELKARQLDDPRALFHDAGLVGPRLDDFLIGETDAPTYLEQWLESQAWSAGTAEWGGGIGLPHHGRGLVEAPRRPSAPRRTAAVDLSS
jgi:hypothetical protein